MSLGLYEDCPVKNFGIPPLNFGESTSQSQKVTYPFFVVRPKISNCHLIHLPPSQSTTIMYRDAQFFIKCETGEMICPVRLLILKDMPQHLQFNKFIHTGYRKFEEVWQCFGSLFYIHNETVNIMTHLVPIIFICLLWRSMFPWKDVEGKTFMKLLGISYITASVAPWIGSVIYHTFLCLDKGENFYQILLRVDIFGVWISVCFGALTNLTTSLWHLPRNLKTCIIVIYCLACLWGIYSALTALTPLARGLSFVPILAVRILIFFLRIYSRGGGDSSTVRLHFFLQGLSLLFGGLIGVLHIPEYWYPGMFDIFGNSHNIMHILVVIAAVHRHMSTKNDIRWMINRYSQTPELRT